MLGISFAVKVPPASVNELQRALQRTVALKGADPVKTVNKAAGYVASFASARGANAKIPMANPARIDSLMRTLVSQSSRRFENRISVSKKTGKVRKIRRLRKVSKIASEWKGTLAAAIVSAINYKGARTKSRRYERMVKTALGSGKGNVAATGAFYRTVARFVKMRKNSAGYLRSGLLPGIKIFKRAAIGGRDSQLNQFKFPPGDASAATQTGSRIVASMSDYATGIDMIAPNALKKAEREVVALFEKWIREDLDKAATAQGFKKA